MQSTIEIFEVFNDLADILETYFDGECRATANFFQKVGASGNQEIVSNVDKEVEEICASHLFSCFPDIPLIGEENYKLGDTLPNDGWVFIIDPIDGTAEFFRGSTDWSVSLAAICNGSPTVGLILLPKARMRFSAYRGGGVRINCKQIKSSQKRQNKRKIAVSPQQILIPRYLDKIIQNGLEAIPIPTVTIKIVSILLGKTNAAIYFAQEGFSAKVWDYAAAILLVEEFGGRMTSFDGAALPITGQNLIHKVGWLATGNYQDHSELVKKMQNLLEN